MSVLTTAVATALRLITKYGSSVQLSPQAQSGVYDPTTSSMSISTPALVSVKGLIEEYAESIRFLGDKLQVGSAVIEGDKKVSIAGSGLTTAPKVNDKLIVSATSTTYQIIGVAIIWAGDAVAIYALHCRSM